MPARLRSGRSRLLVVVASLLAVFGGGEVAVAADRPFTPRFSTNDKGDITFVSNALMTCSTTGTSGGTCATAQGQSSADGPAGTANISSQSNNAYTMVPVDTDGDPATTVNSSTSNLTLPQGATVLFAGLYWGADVSAGGNGGAAPPVTTPNADQAKFKVPGGTYQTLTATVIDFGSAPNTNRYQAFSDVTTQVRTAGSGTYSVGDVRAGTGGDRYAGWTLVVAFRAQAEPPRNLSVFDGMKTIVSNAAPTSISVSGFQTPPAGPVRTRLGFIAYEGDLGLGGDTASLNSSTLGNAANQSTNFFNGSVSRGGSQVTTRNPANPNNLGYDADVLNADGILANGATDATIRLTTSADQYLPGVVTFATELFSPELVLTKSVTNTTRSDGTNRAGDVLRYTVVAQNTGQDGADDVRVTDDIPANGTYVPGSLRITAGPGSPTSPSDGPGDDLGEFRSSQNEVSYRLGTGANSTSGGRLVPTASTTVTFDVQIAATAKPRAELLNTAEGSIVTQSLGIPLAGQSNTTKTIVNAPDLTLTKSHTPAFVAGAKSTFRFVAANVGNLATNGSAVTVTDTLPSSGFSSLRNAGGTGWSCTISGLTLTCTRSDAIGAGASYPPVLVDAIVANPAPASITNVSTVSGGGDADTSNNTATDVGGTSTQADLRVRKTTTTPTVASGGLVAYRVVVDNLGPSTASAVTMTDTLGGAYTAVTATSTRGTCTTVVVCTIGNLDPGESATVTITGRVTVNNQTLTNTATASSPTPDPVSTNNTASADVVVVNTADLRVEKTASTPTPVAGAVGGLTYTVTLTNDGPGTASTVQVLDQIPASVTPTSITPAGGLTCNSPGAGQELVCTMPTLANAAVATVTIVGTVAAAADGTRIDNVARVNSATADPNPTNNTDAVDVTATASSDLAVTKEWGNDTGAFVAITTANPTDTVRIRLTVTNNGPTPATNVALTDTLPANITYVSDDQTDCSAASQLVTCSLATLAVGSTFEVLITATVGVGAAGTTVINSASANGDQDDPIQSNDTDTDRFSVTNAADLVIAKTPSTTATTVGSNVTFTLLVTNNGPSTATGITVTDTLPAGFTFSSSGDCSAVGQAVTCTPSTLTTGSSVTLTYIATATIAGAGRTLTNTASVGSAVLDPDSTNNSSTAEVVIAPLADLVLTKARSTATPAPDEDVTYTLTVTNNGPNTAENVRLTDALPGGLTFISADPDCAYTSLTRTVRCEVGTMENGAVAIRAVTARPTRGSASATLNNTASAFSDTADPDPSNNAAARDVAVSPQVDLNLTKTTSASSVATGAPLTYTLVVANDGPSTATNVAITDTLPTGASFVSATAGQGSCSSASGTVTCQLGTVPSGGTAQVVVVINAPAAIGIGSITNTASVASTEVDVRPQDNTASATTPLVPGSPATVTLTIDKDVNRANAGTSDRLRYTITVRNTSTTTAATTVGVTDTFSRSVDIISASVPGGTCTGERPIRCQIPSIAPNATVKISVIAQPVTGGRVTNTASVTAANSSGAGQQVAPATTTVRPTRVRLAISKKASPVQVTAGGTARFTLTVRNRSKTSAFGVRVCDRLPSGMTFVQARGAKLSGRQACFALGTLRGGASKTLRVVARVDLSPKSARLRNTVTATATNATTVRAQATVNVGGVLGSRAGGVTG